jgi:hypothetical protein
MLDFHMDKNHKKKLRSVPCTLSCLHIVEIQASHFYLFLRFIQVNFILLVWRLLYAQGGILFYLCPSICPSFRPSKIFYSATIDGRNLIFGHKLHTGMPSLWFLRRRNISLSKMMINPRAVMLDFHMDKNHKKKLRSVPCTLSCLHIVERWTDIQDGC